MFDEQGSSRLKHDVIILIDRASDMPKDLIGHGVQAIDHPIEIDALLDGKEAAPLAGAIVLAFLRKSRDEEACKELAGYLANNPVVAICDTRLPSLTRQAIAIGASEILPQRFSPDDLAIAIKHSHVTSQKPSRDGEHGVLHSAVAVMKAGGGVGASAVASQIAQLMADGDPDKRIGLLDFDIQFGTLASNFDVEPHTSLVDILDAGDRLDGEFLRGAMAPVSRNLWLLGAPNMIMPYERIAGHRMDHAIKIIRQTFDFSIIDLPALWNEWVFRTLRNVTHIIIVLEPSVAHVRNARRQIEMLQHQGLGEREVTVVLNRVKSGLFSAFNTDSIEEALGFPVAATLPSDFDLMSAALNQGVPLNKIKRRSKLERGLQKLVQKLSQAAQPQAEGQD